MFEKNLTNSFFTEPYSSEPIAKRISEVLNGKVGFYSVGLYPASLAYNCALHNQGLNILLAPRKGRELFGAFSDNDPVTRGADRQFLKVVPGAQGQPHTSVERGGHFIQEEKPEEISSIISSFIKST